MLMGRILLWMMGLNCKTMRKENINFILAYIFLISIAAILVYALNIQVNTGFNVSDGFFQQLQAASQTIKHHNFEYFSLSLIHICRYFVYFPVLYGLEEKMPFLVCFLLFNIYLIPLIFMDKLKAYSKIFLIAIVLVMLLGISWRAVIGAMSIFYLYAYLSLEEKSFFVGLYAIILSILSSATVLIVIFGIFTYRKTFSTIMIYGLGLFVCFLILYSVLSKASFFYEQPGAYSSILYRSVLFSGDYLVRTFYCVLFAFYCVTLIYTKRFHYPKLEHRFLTFSIVLFFFEGIGAISYVLVMIYIFTRHFKFYTSE